MVASSPMKVTLEATTLDTKTEANAAVADSAVAGPGRAPGSPDSARSTESGGGSSDGDAESPGEPQRSSSSHLGSPATPARTAGDDAVTPPTSRAALLEASSPFTMSRLCPASPEHQCFPVSRETSLESCLEAPEGPPVLLGTTAGSVEAQAAPAMKYFLPSVGSASHFEGRCKPCAFLYEGCANGTSCKFCHLCPPGELKRRKREKLAARRRMNRATHGTSGPQEPQQQRGPAARGQPAAPAPVPPPPGLDA
mmetsp:Transcript_41283/g.127823  ORF Transcript_41283/g.127823 Transcript_41283/m.127823 type:complete len:253 (-) Transcript_41283:31-789(-)